MRTLRRAMGALVVLGLALLVGAAFVQDWFCKRVEERRELAPFGHYTYDNHPVRSKAVCDRGIALITADLTLVVVDWRHRTMRARRYAPRSGFRPRSLGIGERGAPPDPLLVLFPPDCEHILVATPTGLEKLSWKAQLVNKSGCNLPKGLVRKLYRAGEHGREVPIQDRLAACASSECAWIGLRGSEVVHQIPLDQRDPVRTLKLTGPLDDLAWSPRAGRLVVLLGQRSLYFIDPGRRMPLVKELLPKRFHAIQIRVQNGRLVLIGEVKNEPRGEALVVDTARGRAVVGPRFPLWNPYCDIVLDRSCGKAFVNGAGNVKVIDLATGRTLEYLESEGDGESRLACISPDFRFIFMERYDDGACDWFCRQTWLDVRSTHHKARVVRRLYTPYTSRKALRSPNGHYAFIIHENLSVTVLDQARARIAGVLSPKASNIIWDPRALSRWKVNAPHAR